MSNAVLIPASIRLKVDRRGVYYGYDQIAQIADRGPFDLIFVDAPWGGYGRDGALHAAYETLREGGLILLDDADRTREQRTIRRWLLNYPRLSLVANDRATGRGLAVLAKEGTPTSAVPRWRVAAEVWASGIHELATAAWSVRRHENEVADHLP